MSSNIDQDFVEYIVKSLVGSPDKVVIERTIDEKGVLLELTVDPEDLGRIIGKRGATAQSLRTLLRALGTKNDARYNLKIVDNGPEDYKRPEKTEQKPERTERPEQPERSERPAPEDRPEGQNEQKPQKQDKPAGNKRERPVRLSFKEKREATLLDAIDEADEPAAEDVASDRARRTRQELQDLDDLDI